MESSTPVQLYNLGVRSNKMRNYEQARDYFERSLNSGNLNAAVSLGAMYHFGKGVPRDYGRAKQYYERALPGEHNENVSSQGVRGYSPSQGVRGSSPSQGVRGYAPSQGVQGSSPSQGVRGSSPSQGVRGSSPSQGVRGSQSPLSPFVQKVLFSNLGSLYYMGHGVSEDYAKARDYLKKADKLKSKVALNLLGSMYYFGGHGLSKNYTKAVKYLTRALNLGRFDYLPRLGMIYYLGGHGIQRNYKKAREYFEQGYNLIKDPAHRTIGLTSLIHLIEIYENGHGIPADIPTAMTLLIELIGQTPDEEQKNEAIEHLSKLLADKHLIKSFILEHVDLLKQNDRLNHGNLQLLHRIDTLEREVTYQPGGPGYLAARDDFVLQSNPEHHANGLVSP